MKKILAMILVACMALTLASAAVAEGKSPVDGMTVAFIPKVSGNSFFEPRTTALRSTLKSGA